MPPLALSRDHARRFLVRRHLLDPARRLPPGAAAVLAVVERIGSLQFDPLETPGARNHDLVLHARIDGYHRSLCDDLLYAPRGRRRLFEAYNKSLNILPIEDLPLFRLAWERARDRYDGGFLRDHAATAEAILAQIREGGPVSTVEASARFPSPVDWHWGRTPEGRAVLEALFESGRVAIARREGNRRSCDLTERLFPEDLLARRVPPEEAARHRLLSRFRGVGLMGTSGGGELHVGTGKKGDRAAVLAGLVADGVLVPAAVEGLRGPRYVLAGEIGTVEETAREERGARPTVAFLGPLDPLMWDRRLVEDLFGFSYTWEVYTPAAKRVHGYYVLPILFGDRLVGRMEPVLDRDRGVIAIRMIRFEPGFDPLAAPGFVEAFAEALSAYQRLTGATRATWPRTRVARSLREAAGS